MTKQSSQKTIIITGASAGIGMAAARELSKDNQVVIVGRSERTKQVAKKLGVDYFLADYTDLTTVEKLAKDLLKTYPRIDLLINNAGGVMKSIVITKDGFEQTFQVNYIAQFILTNALMDRLVKSKGAVINTSSAAHSFARLRMNNLQFAKTPFIAYSNAKLLDLLHAQELAGRFHTQGVDAVSFHPGIVATNFGDTTSSIFKYMYNTALRLFMKTPEQGADTLVWLANNRSEWENGGYYSNRKIASVTGLAKKTDTSSEVWKITEELL